MEGGLARLVAASSAWALLATSSSSLDDRLRLSFSPFPPPFLPTLCGQEPSKKYFKRADLNAKEREEYLRRFGAKTDETEFDSSKTAKGGNAADDSSEHATLPRKDVIRRLRERGEPILLFGETEVEAFVRLRRSEILEPEVNKGLRNDFQEALEKVDQAFLDEILATQAQNGEGRSTNDVKVPDDGITYEEIQKMAAELGKGEKELDMRVITHFIQFLLLMWGNRLNSRTAAEKTAVRGKLACATYTQTQVYLKPLLRKLKTKSLPEDILDSLTEITRFMMDRDYIKVIITIVLNLADLFISFEPFCKQIISIKSRVGTHK
uniref:Pre-mRNA-splicing factor 18 n=1 Tax=Timema genevievae TaxID=629358 RepID=A0A7R9JVI9_TIMGE|nr:unnamed protein product [Timema genevievae]